MKEAFRLKRFNEEQVGVIRHLNEIIASFVAQGVPRNTLRTVYYQFIAQDLFPHTWIDAEYNLKNGLEPDTKNTVKNYKKLGDIVSDARLAGLVDWDAIVDLERQVHRPNEFGNVRDLVEAAVRSYRLPRWEGQTNYVEIWVEKNGMTVSIEPVARKWHVPLVANKGYGSMTNLYEGSKRFLAAMDQDQHCFILYLGDHDPSGLDMDQDIEKRMRMFGADILEVERIALTTAQVQRYNPPPNPAKLTDSRAEKYIATFGRESWEVNALSPTDINLFIERRLKRLVDKETMDAVVVREDRHKKNLIRAIAGLRDSYFEEDE